MADRVSQQVADRLSQEMASRFSSSSDQRQRSQTDTLPDQSMIPHITTVYQMLSALSTRFEELDGSVLRLTGRVLDLQRQVMGLGIPRSGEFVPPISVLSAEGDSLRRTLEAWIETLKDHFRSSSDVVSTQVGSLMQSISRVVGQLDSIRLILLSQTSSSFAAGPSRPPARATPARASTSSQGRGRRGRSRPHGLAPDYPHHISDSSSDASSRDLY